MPLSRQHLEKTFPDGKRKPKLLEKCRVICYSVFGKVGAALETAGNEQRIIKIMI